MLFKIKYRYLRNGDNKIYGNVNHEKKTSKYRLKGRKKKRHLNM